VDRPGPAAAGAVGVHDMPQPRAPRPPIAVQQQEMPGPVSRTAEPTPQTVAELRPPGAGEGLVRPSQPAAQGDNENTSTHLTLC